MGVIDVAGEVLPVLNVRRRFQMPERPVDVTDQFLVATAGKRKVALAIDQAHGLIDAAPEEWVETAAVMPGLEQVQGVLKRDDGLVLIHDLERFLSLEEAAALEAALDPEAADA
jgi:purine-binding chemotaxis protein CheW